jgi:hypothetical protein
MLVRELKEAIDAAGGGVQIPDMQLDIIGKKTTETRRGGLTLAEATGEDASGEITVTLWNEEIDAVSVGDRIRITSGWGKRYKGNYQASRGQRGRLDVIPQAARPIRTDLEVEDAVVDPPIVTAAVVNSGSEQIGLYVEIINHLLEAAGLGWTYAGLSPEATALLESLIG